MEVAIREATQARSNSTVLETRVQDLETRLTMRTNEVHTFFYPLLSTGLFLNFLIFR